MINVKPKQYIDAVLILLLILNSRIKVVIVLANKVIYLIDTTDKTKFSLLITDLKTIHPQLISIIWVATAFHFQAFQILHVSFALWWYQKKHH